MNMNSIISTPEADKGFYPTPPEIGAKLLDGVDWRMVQDVLEPSAGKGNLVDAIAEKWLVGKYRNINRELVIDCIEIDPYLRQILTYEWGGERAKELYREIPDMSYDYKTVYDRETGKRREISQSEAERYRKMKHEKEKRDEIECRIVHDDFFTFDSRKHYDLIVMNPPFADGDKHLLKALEIVKKNGGEIRCILNAETLLNPYTNRRRLLKDALDEAQAEISFVDGGFSGGERRTDVRVAIIKVVIPYQAEESEIFSRLRKAANIDEVPISDVTDMTVSDFLGRIVANFGVECDAGIGLIKEFTAMRPYIMDSFEDKSYPYPNLTLCVGDPGRQFRGDLPSVNKFLQLTRAKYWEALFSNKEFIGRLTSNLRDKYYGMVKELANYDFTMFNIQKLVTEMNAEMNKGIQDTIVALFEKLTEQHSWYPETQKNVHYYNGWATNKAHKIASKVIIPTYGLFADSHWNRETFNVREAESTISDIEKVFEYLDGNMTASVDLHGVLQRANEAGQTKNIPCKFFDVTLYKKGTMHIKFHNQELVDRFNIYCCRKKGWLPPNYGKSTYSSMTPAEKSVVDGFHGNGDAGSGAEAYATVMARSGYYLSEPTGESPLMLGAHE